MGKLIVSVFIIFAFAPVLMAQPQQDGASRSVGDDVTTHLQQAPKGGQTARDAPLFILDKAPGIIDLYSLMPRNITGLAGSPILSMGCTSAGCPLDPVTGKPYDSQRTQIFVHTTTLADSRRQEYSIYAHQDAVSGASPFWKPKTSYSAGTQITSGYQYQTDADCVSGTNAPTQRGGRTTDGGTCTWRWIGEGTNGKTVLGLSQDCRPGAGSCWGMAINQTREPNPVDPTRFSTNVELDTNSLDGDHPPGSPTGDVYGLLMGGVMTSGSGTVAIAPGGQGPVQSARLTTVLGKTSATLSPIPRSPLPALYGIYPNQLVTAASVPPDTFITHIDQKQNTVALSRPARLSGTVTATFVNYGWHCGVCFISPYGAKDEAFANGSMANVGFVNNAVHNGTAGFQDAGGTAVNPNPLGFLATGWYGAAAFDSTAAHTGTAFRAISGQKVCLDVNQGCFYRSGGDYYFDTQAGRYVFDTDGSLAVRNTVRSLSDTPKVSACGEAPTVSGNSQAGIVSVGAGSVTTCKITLASRLPAPFAGCTLTPANRVATATKVGAYAAYADRTTTSWMIRGAALAGAAFNYICM